MKLFLIRYTKLFFFQLQMHRLFGWATGLLSNLLYLTKLSKWIAKNRKLAYNDFPSKWDYNKRYGLYEWVIQQESLTEPIDYFEFGVAGGHSFRWWLQKNQHPSSKFYGFDTFDGLPENWGLFKKGSFSNQNQLPSIDDERGKFYKGLFQQTLPTFLANYQNQQRKVVMLDADLYSATLYVLTTLHPYLKKGDIVLFDEFVVPTHEFKAYLNYIETYYSKLQPIGAANNYYFVAMKMID